MLSFGYSRDQLKVIIHGRHKSKNYDYIPMYLITKYLAIPDGSKAIRDAIFNKGDRSENRT